LRTGLAKRAAWAVVATALLLAALALLEPCFQVLVAPAAATSLVGLIGTRGAPRRGALLAAAWVLAAAVGPGMPADSWGYLAWLRSLAFDGDVDLGNEWAALGFDLGPSGRLTNPTAVGPAVTWSPFFAIGIVYGLLPAALAVEQWRQGRLRIAWVALSGAAALAAFTPQLVVWLALYGRFVTVPQGGGFMDWSSPRLLDVLLSADHGLVLTPLMLLGIGALLLPGAAPASLRLGGLTVFAATAWTNGSVADYAGGTR